MSKRYTSRLHFYKGFKEWLLFGLISLSVLGLLFLSPIDRFFLITFSLWIIGLTTYKLIKIKKGKILAIQLAEDSIEIIQKDENHFHLFRHIDVTECHKGIVIHSKLEKIFIWESEWDDFSLIKSELSQKVTFKSPVVKNSNIFITILEMLPFD